MRLEDAQREMREVFLGGSVGQFVSGALWLVSAAIGTWGSRSAAIVVLLVGGMFIFPLTLLALRLLGGRASVSKENPLTALAMQVAFTVPLAIPLVLAATRAHPAWFYPGFLIVVGAHYLPFMTLYGLRQFAVPAAIMVGAGWALPVLAPEGFALGGWLGGAVLVAVGLWLRLAHRTGRAPR